MISFFYSPMRFKVCSIVWLIDHLLTRTGPVGPVQNYQSSIVNYQLSPALLLLFQLKIPGHVESEVDVAVEEIVARFRNECALRETDSIG